MHDWDSIFLFFKYTNLHWLYLTLAAKNEVSDLNNIEKRHDELWNDNIKNIVSFTSNNWLLLPFVSNVAFYLKNVD